MNQIDQLFQNKEKDILSIYFSAGYPNVEDTVPTLQMLEKQGVDLVEVGIPFSDPVADGPVIQLAAKQSLENGMSLKLLFEQLAEARKSVKMPIVLMGYWNSVYKYGVEAFLKDCQKCEISGVIIPDLPLDEYEDNYRADFESYGVYNILLVTPQTSQERLDVICKAAKGFLYMVSTSATTGSALEQDAEKEAYFQKTAERGVPTLIGFGIQDKASFENASRFSNGAIIGTAFVESLKVGKGEEFVTSLK